MARKPQNRPMGASTDTAESYLGQPKCTEKMVLQCNNNSVRVTIPRVAAQFLGYDPGEAREVEIYEDGVFIPAEAPDE